MSQLTEDESEILNMVLAQRIKNNESTPQINFKNICSECGKDGNEILYKCHHKNIFLFNKCKKLICRNCVRIFKKKSYCPVHIPKIS